LNKTPCLNYNKRNPENERQRLFMDNNKNRQKDRKKSNPEWRKIDPQDNKDVGIVDGNKIGVHDSKHEKN
jgi:hypothetical protein